MDVSRNSMLGELASDAASERGDFVVQATEQLAKFLDRNRDRIAELGGLTLIDDDPDYLSVAPDCTFRVRSRFEDPTTGEWVSETEVVETASELVELYNPAEVYAAFAEAAREAAGLDSAAHGGGRADGSGRRSARGDLRAGSSMTRMPAPPTSGPPGRLWSPMPTTTNPPRSRCTTSRSTSRSAARPSEARLIDQFEEAVSRLSPARWATSSSWTTTTSASCWASRAGSARRSCPRTPTGNGAS